MAKELQAAMLSSPEKPLRFGRRLRKWEWNGTKKRKTWKLKEEQMMAYANRASI
jgi:hypothetical protein